MSENVSKNYEHPAHILLLLKYSKLANVLKSVEPSHLELENKDKGSLTRCGFSHATGCKTS